MSHRRQEKDETKSAKEQSVSQRLKALEEAVGIGDNANVQNIHFLLRVARVNSERASETRQQAEMLAYYIDKECGGMAKFDAWAEKISKEHEAHVCDKTCNHQKEPETPTQTIPAEPKQAESREPEAREIGMEPYLPGKPESILCSNGSPVKCGLCGGPIVDDNWNESQGVVLHNWCQNEGDEHLEPLPAAEESLFDPPSNEPQIPEETAPGQETKVNLEEEEIPKE